MKTELLAAAAAIVLIAGAGGANAQQTTPTSPKLEQGQAQPGGGATQPGSGADVQNKASPKTGKDARGGAQAQGQDGEKPGMKTQSGGQAQDTSPGGPDVKKKGSAQDGAPMRDGKRQVQDRDRPGQQDRTGQRMERDTQDRAGQKTEGGQAQGPAPGGGDRVQLSEQQRTRISQTIKQETTSLRRVQRTNINFTLNVGAVVPRTVELYPLPAPIITVVPAYRGYLYIVVDDELLIIHPRTYEIVAVIQA